MLRYCNGDGECTYAWQKHKESSTVLYLNKTEEYSDICTAARITYTTVNLQLF